MKDIDYMEAEMEKAADPADVYCTHSFTKGWRAALEAAHAKVQAEAQVDASAGHAVANGNVWKYWAMPGHRIFMWEGYAITPTQIQWQGWWIGPDGDACLSNEGFTPEDVEARGYKPCRNLCQAREVAGFVAKASAGGEGKETPRYWASASQKAYAVITDEWGVGMHVLGHEPRQSNLEARDFYRQHQTDIDSKDWFIQCTTEAEARRIAGFENKEKA